MDRCCSCGILVDCGPTVLACGMVGVGNLGGVRRGRRGESFGDSDCEGG